MRSNCEAETVKAQKPRPKTKRNRTRNVWRYYELLKGLRALVVGIFFFGAFSSGVSLLQPYVMRYAIDQVAMNRAASEEVRMKRLLFVAVLMISLIGLSIVASYCNGYWTVIMNQKVTSRLRRRLLRHMLRLPLPELTQMKVGGAVSRLNQDTSTISSVVSRILINPGLALLQAAVALLMACVLNWRMSLAALAIIIPLGGATKLYANRLRPLFAELGKLGADLSARTVEMFGGVRVTRIYRRETAECQAYLGLYHQIVRKTLAARRRQITLESFSYVAFSLIQVVIVILGVYLILQSKGTVGDIIAIIIYSNRIMGPIQQAVNSYGELQEDLACMDRIFEVLDMKEDKLDRPEAIEAPPRVETLAVKELTFTHAGAPKPALSNISFKVRGGLTVALVGRSGAGKTTLTDLLSRFYDPQEGAILINGRDIRDFKLKSYRKLLGLVQQETFIFDGSIRENIAYSVLHATDAQIITAAKCANVHEFVEAMPAGYDTIVGERGVKLSGGQRQRISIARAFLADPEILILDEATSNLDTENEQAIQAALTKLLSGRTTFIIAHRLSTIVDADVVVVLEEGRIREIGSHQELIASRDTYFDMIDRQRRSLVV
jgi:ATP-binding cassette, subfamily B, bacterial